MKIGMMGAFVRNYPFGTEIAFKKGLEEIGCKVFAFDPSRPNSSHWCSYGDKLDAVIVFKNAGDFSSLVWHELNNGCKTIVYQPDDSRAPGIRGMLEETRAYCDYAFTFDSTGARVAEEIGYVKAEKLLVTADPDIYKPLELEKDIDFSFVGSYSNPVMHHSRRTMIEILRSHGFKVASADGVWVPEEINKIYNRSKVVLNHATNVGQEFGTGWGFQCRHFEAAMAKSCLLSNSILDPADGPENFFDFNSQRDLISNAGFLLENEHVRNSRAEEFYREVMDKHSPKVRAHQIVKFIEGL